MTTISGSFVADGVSLPLKLGKAAEDVAFSVTGPFTGLVYLERAVNPSMGAWEVAYGPFNQTLGVAGTLRARPLGRFRFRASGVSGSISYSVSDSEAILSEDRNQQNVVVGQRRENGDRIIGDLYVDGSLYVGGNPVTSEPASETDPGVIELATAAETLAGTDDERAVHPLGLQGARTADLATAAADATSKANAAQAAAISTASGDATTKANAAQAAAIATASADATAKADAAEAAANAYTDAEIAAIPGGVTPPLVEDSVASRTGSFTAVAGVMHRVDTSGGVSTPTMPSAPADKTRIRFEDFKHSFSTNNITVTRGGSDTVMGATTFVGDITDVSLEFSYHSATTDWELV